VSQISHLHRLAQKVIQRTGLFKSVGRQLALLSPNRCCFLLARNPENRFALCAMMHYVALVNMA